MTTSTRTLHVILRKEDLKTDRLFDKDVVVLDVLFATTTIVHGLSCGLKEVLTAKDPYSARALSERHGDSHLLAGEHKFELIRGFAPPTPLALASQLGAHQGLIYTSTNGTVAIEDALAAGRLFLGSLLNASATAAAIAEDGRNTVLLVCAGTAGGFNQEDFYGAGSLVHRLLKHAASRWRLTDAARASLGYFRSATAIEVLRGSLVGQLITGLGLGNELDFAAQQDSHSLVASSVDGVIVSLG